MKNIVFDSFAMLALFREEKGHDEVAHLLTEISLKDKDGFMCVVNVGEVYYITARKQDEKKAQIALDSLKQFPLDFVVADMHLSIGAAKLKAKYKLSFADAYAAALTIQKKAILITGDKEFKTLEKEPNFKVKFI
jgi:predicted nucleic acid-binding protein